jgi:hypothetical protein
MSFSRKEAARTLCFLKRLNFRCTHASSV